MKGMKEISTVALCAGSPVNVNRMVTSSLRIPSIPLHTISCVPNQASTQSATTIDMPIIGIGTYKFKKGSGDASRAIEEALKLGYRQIDTAFIYGGEQTEKEVGSTLAAHFKNPAVPLSSKIERSDIFLTSKQWRAYHGYDATLQCLKKSLERLQTDYLDLYLIHWPGCAYNTMARSKKSMEESSDGPFVYAKDGHGRDEIQSLRAETWRAMEDSVYDGKCRAIGVSNFTIRHLEALKKTARIWPPAVNQIELHPYNPQKELVEYCRKEGIVLQAYASLGGQDSGKKTWNVLGGKLLERDEVKAIAEKYQKMPAQVLLRWATQQGFCVIPKSSNIEHMRLNLEAVSVFNGKNNGDDDENCALINLSQEDMEALDTLDQSFIKSEDIDGSGEKRMIANKRARLCWVRDPLKMLDFD